MDHIAAAEERVVSERLRRKVDDVNSAVQKHLAGIHDHVNYALQQAYFKCSYECFDRRRTQQEISSCVERCSVPVVRANSIVEEEMMKFQERLQRSVMVCQDKYESMRLQNLGTGAAAQLEACVDGAIQDNLQMLPHVVEQLEASLGIIDQ